MASLRAKHVASCNRRARSRGVMGTLTTLDWQRTLDFFAGCCVYCGNGAETLDHFQPLALGGGTTPSNGVPCCFACNAWKADRSLSDLEVSFVSSKRLTAIRGYLEEIGKSHQARLQRLYEREPVFARMQGAVLRLKQHCEQHAIAQTDVSTSYAYLRCMLFGVEWDPADYFQALVSLLWQQEHSSGALLTLACEDAQCLLCGEELLTHVLRTYPGS